MQRGREAGLAEILPLNELRQRVSKAGALISLYEKEANSSARTPADVVHAQREMKVIREEILSELLHTKGLLQKIQKGLGSD